MAPLDSKQQAKQLRREHAAMLSHYELMRGLSLISRIRLRKFLDLLEHQRAENRTEDETLRAVRQAIRQEATIEPKARMLFDADRELDLYPWGPLQLFFCIACAFLDQYRYLRNQDPSLMLADLDRYIEENRAGLDAARKLRNWVLHPGTGRRPDDAMMTLFSIRDGWRTAYPLDIMNHLVDLGAKFLEQLHGHAR